MSFEESVRVCMKKYLDFEGRADRSEYLWFYLAVLLAQVAASMVSGRLLDIVVLLLLLPSLSVSIRRLHDTGRSGLYLLIPIYNIYLLFFVGSDPGPNQYGEEPVE